MSTVIDEEQSALRSYKEKIDPVTRGTLVWERDLIFKGATPQGYEIDFDADVQWGCKPTDALLLSLAGCMGIDVVMILQKLKVKLTSFRLELTGTRNPTPPQYFRCFEIVLHAAGEGLEERKVARALALSREKYCSVFNSLRSDVKLTVRHVLEK